MNDKDKTDYEQTLAYFHALNDVRFKLLAFLPILSGTAVVVLPGHTTIAQQLALAILGGLITLALTFYDQRNTQIYDRLVCRAQFLEKQLRFRSLPGDVRKDHRENIGPLHSRPELRGLQIGEKKWFKVIWHDFALAMIYAACFSAWCFMGLDAIFLRSNDSIPPKVWVPVILVFGVYLAGLRWLAELNYRDGKKIKESWNDVEEVCESD